MDGRHHPRRNTITLARLPVLILAALLVTACALLAGIGFAAVLGQSGTAESWSRWSDVGQTFGTLSTIISGLALCAVVMTAYTQLRELRRSSSAELSMLHLEILKLGIEDAELAEVWPEFEPGLSIKENRQFLYASIIYQFHWTSLKLDNATDEAVLRSMRYLYTSQIMRRHWAATARTRATLVPGSPEHVFSQKVAEICRDYDTVASSQHHSEQRAASEVRGRVRVGEEAA